MESEFVGVFGSYNELIYEDLKEIDHTLKQIAELSSDASDQLYQGLDKVGLLFHRHKEIAASLASASGDQLSQEHRDLHDELYRGPEAFDAQKGQILRSMQATDMVHQLLGHCRARMNRIRKMSNEIERVTERRMEAFAAMVGEMQILLEDTRFKLDSELGKSVEQINVDEGEIEFF